VSTLCGPGYTGAACGGCARGFFPAEGACLACPSLGSQFAYLLPPLQFLGGLLAFGAAPPPGSPLRPLPALKGVPASRAGALLLQAAAAALAEGGRALGDAPQ
jgi:hypothetical protein